MADWLFIADAHLREGDIEPQKRVVRFLEKEEKNLDTLVILGDLFEFWFGFEPFAFEGYQPVLNKLEDLAKRGVQIRYTEGNHDFSLGSYFDHTLRAQIEAEDAVVGVGGMRIYMAHGDLANRRDRAYRIFRRILKNRFTYWTIRRAGPRVSKRVARFLSTIRAGRGEHKHPERIERIFEEFAITKLREGFDVVILAHSHLPQSCAFEIDGKQTHYFNVGDWVRHFSYLRYRPGQGFSLERFQS
jgi:UDP-2,3-diacylglucosamine hydrolase